MEKNKNAFRECGWVLLIFVVIDLVQLAFRVVDFFIQKNEIMRDKATISFAIGTFVIYNIILFFATVTKTYLGIKATKKVNKKNGNKYITIARILGIIYIVLAIFNLVLVFRNYDLISGIMQIIICIANVAIMYLYVDSAKKYLVQLNDKND